MGGCVVKSTQDERIDAYGATIKGGDATSCSQVIAANSASMKERIANHIPQPPKIFLDPMPATVEVGNATLELYNADEKRAPTSVLLQSAHMRAHTNGRPAILPTGISSATKAPDVDWAEVVASLTREGAELQKKLEVERNIVNRLQGELVAARQRDGGPDRQRLMEKDWVKGMIIGTGAHGSVYISLNTRTGEMMATKQITLTDPLGQGQADQELVLSFKREVNILVKLSHPNIVRYIHHQKVGTILTVFQEYVSGGSLESILKQFGALQEPVICRYSEQMFQGIGYLHSQGIIHRDIKGANVLVSTMGVVKLADFGTAKMLKKGSNQLQGPFAAHGSPFWLAPEVLKGVSVSKASDIWSAGCVIIEMATAAPPWAEWSSLPATGVIYRISVANRPPTFPPHLTGLPQDLLGICLAMRPEDRQPSSQILQHLWFHSSSEKKTSQLGGSAQFPSRRPLSVRDGDAIQPPPDEDPARQPPPLGGSHSNHCGHSALYRKPSMLNKWKSQGGFCNSPSMVSFTSSVSTLAQTSFKYRCNSLVGESLVSRVKGGNQIIFSDVSSVRQADGRLASSIYEEGEEEVSISIQTIDLALRWLSEIKEVLPLDEYLKKAEDYDEYGVFMGNYVENLESDSALGRMDTQIIGQNGSMEFGQEWALAPGEIKENFSFGEHWRESPPKAVRSGTATANSPLQREREWSEGMISQEASREAESIASSPQTYC